MACVVTSRPRVSPIELIVMVCLWPGDISGLFALTFHVILQRLVKRIMIKVLSTYPFLIVLQFCVLFAKIIQTALHLDIYFLKKK